MKANCLKRGIRPTYKPKSENMSKVINWTPEKLAKFKKAYKEAETGKKESFIFGGDEFVTGYAKYLIQHLENEFKAHK